MNHPPSSAGIPVRMARRDLTSFPDHPPPSGYTFEGIRPATIREWTAVQRAAERWLAIPDDLFEREFGTWEPEIAERCHLLRDPRGNAVGTISAWFHPDFAGESWGRVHWVAVHPSCQGRGLGKVLMTHCLRLLRAWHDKAYLSTSSNRIPAIRLYRYFGFTPLILHPEENETWKRIEAAIGD